MVKIVQEFKEKNKKASKVDMKRPKTSTQYPRKLPTYVVAFSVQDTYDNLNTLHSDEQTPKTSFDSINTLCALDTTEVENVLQSNDVSSTNEVKIEIVPDIEHGATELNDYIMGDCNKMEEVTEPEVIFNATKYNKRPENGKFLRKKPKKYRRVVKFRNIHFKHKNPKKNVTNTLDKFYGKARKKSESCVKIRKYFNTRSITQIVTRSRILKKAIAKENLQEYVDRISITDDMPFADNDNASLTSSPSTAKRSFVSYSSNNTLTRKGSTSSSINIDLNNLNNTSSVIEVSSEIMIPYKSDVINVAVAVAYNQSSSNETSTSHKTLQTFVARDSLTSTEIPVLTPDGLTSQEPSNVTNPKNIIGSHIEFSDEMSNETLIGTQKTSSLDISSDEDTFFIAKTSSDFNKVSLNSTYTLVTNSDSQIRNKNVCPSIFDECLVKSTEPQKPTLLDTVINMGMFPEITPSTSSNLGYKDGSNNVIITGDMNKRFTIPQIKGTVDIKRQLSKTVLRKPLNIEQHTEPQNNLNLPNEAKIKGIREGEKQKINCTDESRNNNLTNLTEVWDRLTLVVDVAVRRLEETLSEKIIWELKKTLANFDPLKRTFSHPDTPKSEVTVNALTITMDDEIKKNQGVMQNATHENNEDMCLQCNLIKNSVIDQIMLKLSMEGSKFPTGGCSTKSMQRLMKPKIIRDYFEILKAPAVESQVEGPSKDELTTMMTLAEEAQNEELTRFSYVKLLFQAPIAFLRENIFIITSVPAFFILLLCFYGLIIMVMKP